MDTRFREYDRKDIQMGRRRDRLDGRIEKQIATRRKNSARKIKERARKAARAAQALKAEQ